MRDMPRPSHPGEILKDELEERGWTQAHLARLTGFTPKHINQVVKERAHVGVAFAVALERTLGVTAFCWLQFQLQHDLWTYRNTGRPTR
jgi:addiction module HigA family antidote